MDEVLAFTENWTCSQCQEQCSYETAIYLAKQLIENDLSVLFDKDCNVYARCNDCGSVFHGRCLDTTPNNIACFVERYICTACRL